MTAEPQEQIVELLEKARDVEVDEIIPEDRKDLVNGITMAMAKLGLCAIVQTPVEKVTHPELPGPVYDDVVISVVVHESPTINRAKTDTTCRQQAKAISKALHHKRINYDGRATQLMSLGVAYQQDSIYLTYAVDFKLS